MLNNKTCRRCKISVAVFVCRHSGDFSFRQSLSIIAVEPITLIVINANAFVRAYPDITCFVNINAGNIVAQKSRNVNGKLRPVPAFAHEYFKSAACSADINFIITKSRKACRFAGYSYCKVKPFRAFLLTVKMSFCKHPFCRVKVIFHIDNVALKTLLHAGFKTVNY